MNKRLLAAALVLGVLGGVSAVPSEPALAGAQAEVDLVLRCIGPLTLARTRPVAVPSECGVFFWTNLRPTNGWHRSLPLPPGRPARGVVRPGNGTAGFPGFPPMPLPPTPLPMPLSIIFTLGHIA